MFGVLLFLCIAILIFIILFIVSWTTHIEMNKQQGVPYDWCTFKRFIKEFNKYKDHPELKAGEWGRSSIFLCEKFDNGYKDTVYLHANIVQFDGKCMILYPYSYLRYCIWKRNFNKKAVDKRQKGLWE